MTSRAVRYLGIAATLGGLIVMVAFFVGLYTMGYSLMGSLMPREGEEPFKIGMTPDPSGALTLEFSMGVRNQGFLGTTFTVSLELLSADGESIVRGSDTKALPPGSSGELEVEMTVTPEDVVRYALETSRPTLSFGFNIRSLFDLIGMGISFPMEMGGG
ncbi:MAG: hypothetical protein ACE5OY_05970 [Candidatus Bathyarchaeia archaeon]